jgi:DNA-binding winged helix-turn-helix (wHTH) protein/TolB-like protein
MLLSFLDADDGVWCGSEVSGRSSLGPANDRPEEGARPSKNLKFFLQVSYSRRMRAIQSEAFAFGDFVLVPKERLLLRGGEPIALTAKAFDLLVVLVRRAGELVTKDELFEEVWPGTFVQETSLTVNISAVRKALEDVRDGNRMIQTVSGRGYRFVAPVVAGDANESALLRTEVSPVAVTTSDLQPGPRAMSARTRFGVPPLTWILLAAVAGVVAVATAIWSTQPGSRGVAFASVAVLPFLSDTAGSNYLADGLSEATVNGLMQLQGLRVAPRASVLRYKGSVAYPKHAGRELDVSAVVTASVTQQDRSFRIQVDLVDVARDAQIWGTVYQATHPSSRACRAEFCRTLRGP